MSLSPPPPTSTFDRRWHDVQHTWRNNAWLFGVFGFVLGMLAMPAARLLLTDLDELLAGLVPETFGIVFTVLIIDRLYRNRERRRHVLTYQSQLAHEAGSTVNDIAVRAVDDLRKRGWLTDDDGLLRGQNLVRAALSHAQLVNANLSGAALRQASLTGARLTQANLQQADLTRADLTNAQLQAADLRESKLHFAACAGARFGAADLSNADAWHAVLTHCDMVRCTATGTSFRAADLTDTDLSRSNLQHARFDDANLHRANLHNSDLRHANFRRAGLEQADLTFADLRGADLTNADLHTAELDYAKCDGTLTLPDGSAWQPGENFDRFTDPNHPGYWQPSNANRV